MKEQIIMRILIVSKCPTHPTNAGNRRWILAQTEILRELGNEIYFLYIDERPLRSSPADSIIDYEATKKYWRDHFFYLRISKVEKFYFNVMKQVNMHFRGGYQSCDVNYPHRLTGLVNNLNTRYKFDICIVNYYYLTKLFKQISIPKKVLFTHDCIAYKDLAVGEKTMTIDANNEAKALQRSPYIFALQDVEMHYFEILSPLSKVYNIYSKYIYHPSMILGNHNMVFLSGSNDYNINGLRWFLKEIFTLIKQHFTDAQCIVGGAICTKIVNDNLPDGVKLIGYVDSPKLLYDMGDVAINPTYQGTGLKIKTFEAISYDKVTMVHPHSMKGVFDKDHSPLYSSANPQEWLDFLIKLWETKEIFIEDIKKSNKEYMKKMNEFIVSEYKRFLND
ncbi:glycosyltransferase family 4 protein [Phocaeicola dorei]|uniref:glycosyltransferase family 4 protein n=1 Tax=Phocaeicola dorei TaxID=357276 RepID=UPI00356896A1